MKLTTFSAIISVTLPLAAGLPTATTVPCSSKPQPSGGGSDLATVINSVTADKTKSCDSADPKDKGECATAADAAPNIEKSFETYKLDNSNEKAAVIAVMLYESGSFKYNKNHFPAPGKPGQGTRNMQSPAFNKQYAEAVLGADAVQKIGDDPANILVAVNTPELSFGSAAWFLTSQCKDDVRKNLQSGSKEGWDSYITDCIGTTADDDRYTIYAALQKFIGKGL